MFRVLFLFFIVVPIIEIAVLMQVGSWLGTWPTIAIVIFTAWLGAKNVRQQGLATMSSVQVKMAQGQLPNDEIVAGVLLLIAGVLLVTPGFVTDAFGLALLVPQFRAILIAAVQKNLVLRQNQGFNASYHSTYEHDISQRSSSHSSFEKSTLHQGQTLDGEYERKE